LSKKFVVANVLPRNAKFEAANLPFWKKSKNKKIFSAIIYFVRIKCAAISRKIAVSCSVYFSNALRRCCRIAV